MLVLSYANVGTGSEARLGPFERGSCYFASSEASTPYLSIPVGPPTPSFNYSTTGSTWSPPSLPSSQQQQQTGPILDLCNQVQGIWLRQGAWEAFIELICLIYSLPFSI